MEPYWYHTAKGGCYADLRKIRCAGSASEKGCSSYRLREEKLISPRTMQKIRYGERITMNELETICDLLHVQPNRVIEWERW